MAETYCQEFAKDLRSQCVTTRPLGSVLSSSIRRTHAVSVLGRDTRRDPMTF